MIRRRRIGVIVALPLLVLLAGILGAGMLRLGSAASDARTITAGQSIYSMALDARSGRAVLTRWANSARVQMLDTRSGTLGRPIALGTSPWLIFVSSMVLDEATGHIFVLTAHFASTARTRDAVRMLDERSGRLLRATPVLLGAGFPGQLALDAPAHRVFLLSSRLLLRPTRIFSSGLATVRVFDTVSGRLLRTVAISPSSRAPNICPCYGQWLVVDQASGAVFVSDGGSSVVSRLDGASGRVRWNARLNPAPRGPINGPLIGGVSMDARTGRVFVLNIRAGAVQTLDAASGRLLRSTRIGAGPALMAVARAAGRVFVFNGMVRVLDAASGRLLRAIPTSRSVTDTALVADERTGRVFLADEHTGTITMLDAASGRVLRTVTVAPTIASGGVLVDQGSGRLIVSSAGPLDSAGNVTGMGSVSVLDGRSGAIVRTEPVGANPGSIFVDRGAGRVVVVNQGGPADLPDPWRWMPPWLRRIIPLLPAPPPRRIFSSVSTFDLR